MRRPPAKRADNARRKKECPRERYKQPGRQSEFPVKARAERGPCIDSRATVIATQRQHSAAVRGSNMKFGTTDRKNLLDALRVGTIGTNRARRNLNAFAGGSRIFELRYWDAFNITMRWRREESGCRRCEILPPRLRQARGSGANPTVERRS